jgi:hypothetical protein
MGYPKPDGYVGSGADGNMMRTGTGGRLGININSTENLDTDSRRNPATLDTLPGEEL